MTNEVNHNLVKKKIEKIYFARLLHRKTKLLLTTLFISVLDNFTISLVTKNKIFKVDIDLVHNKKCLASYRC